MDKIRAVRIMCDWCADGVWRAPSIPNSSIDGFRVSDALWQRLQAWQAWHDAQDPRREDRDWGDFDIVGFVAEGFEIAKAVKRELPDWIVVYHDHAKSVAAFLGASRSQYEMIIE